MIIVLFSLTVTSTLAVVLGGRAAGNRRPIRQALTTTLECIGSGVVFLCLNLTIGMVFVLMVRTLTPGFLSLYDVTDTLLVVLSMAQGTVFQIWWRSADAG